MSFPPPELKLDRINEKKELQGLNTRLAKYIENVRLNSAELERLKGKGESRVKDLYEREMTELRNQVHHLISENADFEEHNKKLFEKVQTETRQREEAEQKLSKQASLTHMKKKVKALEDEIIFLKKVHIEELQAQDQYVQMDSMVKPDLTAALQDFKQHYENMVKINLQGQYKSEETTHSQTILEHKLEITQHREKVQTLTSEKESLEHQIVEMKNKFISTETSYQDKIKLLEGNISKMKLEMANNQRMYVELADAKLKLDVEIATYRKLLEVEERRIDSPAKGTNKVDNSVNKNPTSQAISEGKEGVKNKDQKKLSA